MSEQLTREAVIKRIQKLSRMTIANGCSENEAMVAAKLISDLTEQYQIGQTELTLKEEQHNVGEGYFSDLFGKDRQWHLVFSGIALYCNCRVYRDEKVDDVLKDLDLGIKTTTICFFGFPEDIAGALALSAIVSSAINTECAKEKKANHWSPSKAADFRLGMAMRINQRLRDLIRARDEQQASTGSRALVVVKSDIVNKLFSEAHPNLRRGYQVRRNNSDAYYAGYAKGDSVGLNSGRLGETRRIGN